MVPGAEHDDDHDGEGSDPRGDRVSSIEARAPRAKVETESDRAKLCGPTIRAARSSGVPDPRTRAAWCSWLSALARDAEVALAAALTYEALAPEARDAWLDALDADAPDVGVPAVALFAPLLGVEEDPARRARMIAAIGPDAVPTLEPRALRGIGTRGDVVLLLVLPLYLEFVEVLACRLTDSGRLLGASHEPLAAGDAFHVGLEWEDARLDAVPMHDAVEELAHAIVAEHREGAKIPEVLHRFADLFAVAGMKSSAG